MFLFCFEGAFAIYANDPRTSPGPFWASLVVRPQVSYKLQEGELCALGVIMTLSGSAWRPGRRGVASALVATMLTIVALAAGDVHAQNQDCASAARRVGDAVILPAWCTVAIEHADRKARLERLARIDGLAVPPKFYEYTVARSDLATLLPRFPADIPVLRVVFDERVFFDFNKSDVRPEAKTILDLVASSMRSEPPDVAVFIAGHTDAIGSDSYNDGLGMRRADAVAHALLDRGIGESVVFRVSFGKSMPIDTNATDDGRQHNRRVEFLFAAKPEAAAVWLARQAADTCFKDDTAAYTRCRNAISVAEEVSRTSTRLFAQPAAAAIRPTSGSQTESTSGSEATSLHGGNKAANLNAPRRFTIDLSRKLVSINVPSR